LTLIPHNDFALLAAGNVVAVCLQAKIKLDGVGQRFVTIRLRCKILPRFERKTSSQAESHHLRCAYTANSKMASRESVQQSTCAFRKIHSWTNSPERCRRTAKSARGLLYAYILRESDICVLNVSNRHLVDSQLVYQLRLLLHGFSL
jgi:hypothetical protein